MKFKAFKDKNGQIKSIVEDSDGFWKVNLSDDNNEKMVDEVVDLLNKGVQFKKLQDNLKNILR